MFFLREGVHINDFPKKQILQGNNFHSFVNGVAIFTVASIYNLPAALAF